MAKQQQSLKEKVRSIVADQLCIEETDVTEEPFDKQGMDSLDHVELIMVIEEAFELEIADDAAEKLTALPLLIQYVEAQTGKAKHAVTRT